ncbi:MAG TPA: tRNA pseudouridine(55) synthase TruB, partial [Trueperaceae bacterium]|nr:tRNA pseudouridine(55) synthase TruB [Trueperaceae bacterium]
MPLFCVDKPLGPGSHDVVARARRLLGTRRVGHAGTLDPLASGVLLLLSDEATKLSQFITGHDKSYLAWVRLGVGTPTLDAEGPVSSEVDASQLDAEQVRAALPAFLELDEQRPPVFSAIKRDGERSYAAARRGELEEPPARPAGYRAIDLIAMASDRDDLPSRFGPTGEGSENATLWRPDPAGESFELPPRLPGGGVTALIALRVAAGTYVRAFARDLGGALGVPAHLAGLVRTASGRVDLSRAVPLERLGEAPELPLRAALD